MFYNNDSRLNNESAFGDGIDININNANMNTNTNTNQNVNMNENFDQTYSVGSEPIIEPGREKVIQRNIIHEVKQDWFFLLDQIN